MAQSALLQPFHPSSRVHAHEGGPTHQDRGEGFRGLLGRAPVHLLEGHHTENGGRGGFQGF